MTCPPRGRNDLDREVDAQQPGDVIDGGHQFAPAAAPAVQRPEAAKPLEGFGVGERRIDGAVNAEVAGRSARRAGTRSATPRRLRATPD